VFHTGTSDDLMTPELISLIKFANGVIPTLLERAHATDAAGKVPV